MRTTPKLVVLAIIACCNVTGFVLAGDSPAPSISADDALVKLKEGNFRFATGDVSPRKPTAARRKETAQVQHLETGRVEWTIRLRPESPDEHQMAMGSVA